MSRSDVMTRSNRDSATTVEIRLNGEPYELPEGSTVRELLESLDRHPRTVAVEHNGDIVKREHYGVVELRAGDRVEVVHFVQGG